MSTTISDPTIRRCARVLRMLHELHRLGYQRLRIIPYFGGPGPFWRCNITHAGAVMTTHGAYGPYGDWHVIYSSASENDYFNWHDAKADTAAQLAAKFVERFPTLARLGAGRDWVYVGWFCELMTYADRGELPYLSIEYGGPNDPRFMPTTAFLDSGLPLPPGGELAPGSPAAEGCGDSLPDVKPFDAHAPVRTIRYDGPLAWRG